MDFLIHFLHGIDVKARGMKFFWACLCHLRQPDPIKRLMVLKAQDFLGGIARGLVAPRGLSGASISSENEYPFFTDDSRAQRASPRHTIQTAVLTRDQLT